MPTKVNAPVLMRFALTPLNRTVVRANPASPSGAGSAAGGAAAGTSTSVAMLHPPLRKEAVHSANESRVVRQAPQPARTIHHLLSRSVRQFRLTFSNSV